MLCFVGWSRERYEGLEGEGHQSASATTSPGSLEALTVLPLPATLAATATENARVVDGMRWKALEQAAAMMRWR